MKPASDFLFDLIKSLNGSEKRYCHLFLRRHLREGSISLTLYQALQGQDHYDESSALDSTGLSRNHFAVQKTILYKQLLQALIQYNAETDLLQKLQQDVFAARLLLQKGLTLQARTKLRHIREDARRYEQHEILLQIIQLEAAISAREQFRQTSMEDIAATHREITATTDQVLLESTWRYAYSTAQKLQLQAGGKSDKAAGEVKTLLKSVTAKTAKNKLTKKALMDKMQSEALYHFMNRETAKAFEVNTAFITMIEADEALIRLYPQRYFAALNNYLIDCFNLSETAAFQQTLVKMRALKDNTAFKKLLNLEINIFRITYQAELNYLISKGQFAQAVATIENVKSGLKNYKENIPVHYRMNLEYLCAYALFGAGRYSDASAMLDSVQRYRRGDTAVAPDVMTAVMQVICHYELKNYSIIDSLVKSAKRKLNQHKEMASESVFELLNSINNFAVKPPETSDWEKLQKKLEQSQDKTDASYPGYFDYRTYVAARSGHTSYAAAWLKG